MPEVLTCTAACLFWAAAGHATDMIALNRWQRTQRNRTMAKRKTDWFFFGSQENVLPGITATQDMQCICITMVIHHLNFTSTIK